MKRERGILLALAVSLLPLAAGAQPASCAAPTDDDARMRCDIDRAESILSSALRLHGPAPSAIHLEIVDTTSPSGAAYVYTVFEEGSRTLLDARSVPYASAGTHPSTCSLRTHIPDDVANRISATVTEISAKDIPAYGPREEVTYNPDGSRSVRLVIDSHDIITRLHDSETLRLYSRHATAGDDVTRLNNLVIGVANVSSGWSCNPS